MIEALPMNYGRWRLHLLLAAGLGLLSQAPAPEVLPEPPAAGAPTNQAPAPLDKLIQDLLSEDEAAAATAEELLLKQGAPALSRLQEVLAELPDEKEEQARRRRLETLITAIEAELQPRIRELVKRLGSEGFKERRRAREELEAIGKPALAALREAAASRDPEVRLVAQELATDLEIGIWRRLLVAHLAKQGSKVSPDACEPIAPELSRRFSPDHRFFNVKGQGDEAHYWVSRKEAGLIQLATGGDITSMFGGAQPVARTPDEIRAFFQLVARLRYGFGDQDIAVMRVDKQSDTAWRLEVKGRSFTATFDQDGKFLKLHLH